MKRHNDKIMIKIYFLHNLIHLITIYCHSVHRDEIQDQKACVRGPSQKFPALTY